MKPRFNAAGQKWIDFLLALIVPALVVAAWCMATKRGVPAVVMPTIGSVWKAFLKSISTGELKSDMLLSLSRVIKGYLIASGLGVLIGSLMGIFKPVQKLLHPMITSLR